MRWVMTCLAVWAATRPKSIGGSSSVRKSPTCASGLRRCASAERHLRVLVLDRIGHLHVAQQLDLARLAVDLGADVVLQPVLGAAGLLDGLLHRLEHFLALDALFAGDHVGHLQHLQARDIGSRCHVSVPLLSIFV